MIKTDYLSMNIFFLSWVPIICARYHCDKHVVKMIIEYAQMLSTAHRVLDGQKKITLSKNNRKLTRYVLPGDVDDVFYKSTHVNHPCGVWVRASRENYLYLYQLFSALCDEYTHRYGKVHLTDTKLRSILATPPSNIDCIGITEAPRAMPDHFKDSISVTISYRNFYIGDKKKFCSYKKRSAPSWL